MKIAADARFIQGIPFIAKVPGKVGVGVIPKAMTLGLYDILFENMNLTSPSWSDLETIAEELHHAVQFVEMWQNMADIPASTERFGGHAVGREPVQRTTRTIPARRPNYAEATARWKIEYANAAIEAFKEGRELYDNRFERAAKARADAIMTDLKRKFAEKFLKGQSICP